MSIKYPLTDARRSPVKTWGCFYTTTRTGCPAPHSAYIRNGWLTTRTSIRCMDPVDVGTNEWRGDFPAARPTSAITICPRGTRACNDTCSTT